MRKIAKWKPGEILTAIGFSLLLLIILISNSFSQHIGTEADMKLTFIGADHEVTGSCTLIEACGKLEAPGRPTLYATTDAFLRVMGIESLQQLPPLPEVQGSEGTEQLRKSIAKLQEPDAEQQQTLFSDSVPEQTGA